MKKNIILLTFLLSITKLSAQTDTLSSIVILNQDSTLMFTNNDSSYVFNAFIVTQALDGISTVTLACQTLAANAQWVLQKDTSYTWNQVTIDSLFGATSYQICKPNDATLLICLGRLYYSTRYKFTFTLMGNNGILTKEFNF